MKAVSFTRPKGYLGSAGHVVALTLIAVPLLMMAARLVALPGLGLADGEMALLHSADRWDRIPAENWVRASRSAATATAKSHC